MGETFPVGSVRTFNVHIRYSDVHVQFLNMIDQLTTKSVRHKDFEDGSRSDFEIIQSNVEL